MFTFNPNNMIYSDKNDYILEFISIERRAGNLHMFSFENNPNKLSSTSNNLCKIIIRNNLGIKLKEYIMNDIDTFIMKDNLDAILIGDIDELIIYFNATDTIMIDGLMKIEVVPTMKHFKDDYIMDFEHVNLSLFDYINEQFIPQFNIEMNLNKIADIQKIFYSIL